MRIRRITAGLLGLLLLLLCVSCGSAGESSTGNADSAQTLVPQLSRMRAICELSVMDCYFHNVAKYTEEDAERFLWITKDKRFWIEYSGIVTLGVDASKLTVEVDGETVRISVPPVTVQKVDVDTLTEDAFLVDPDSAKITAEDETAAFAEAQAKMRAAAETDSALLSSARQRVEMLLENYVKSIGAATGVQYQIEWIEQEQETSPAASIGGETAETDGTAGESAA